MVKFMTAVKRRDYKMFSNIFKQQPVKNEYSKI